MITLNKSAENRVPLTLFELTTIDDPNYLVEFKNKQTKELSYCLLGTNLSNDVSSYDEFIITDTASPNPRLSQVYLSVGQYFYTAYQLSDAQVSALDFENIDTDQYTSVEGPCQMQVKQIPVPDTFYSNAPLTNTVYEQE